MFSHWVLAQSTTILPGGNNSNIQLNGSKNGISISGLTTQERDAIQNPSVGTLYWNSTQLTAGSGSHFCKECDGNFYQYSKLYSLYVGPIRMF